MAYIADLQNHLVGRLDNYKKKTTKQIQEVNRNIKNHLVGRVRTHGDRTFRKLNKNIRVGANLNEKSSKEEIIKFLHKISSK